MKIARGLSRRMHLTVENVPYVTVSVIWKIWPCYTLRTHTDFLDCQYVTVSVTCQVRNLSNSTLCCHIHRHTKKQIRKQRGKGPGCLLGITHFPLGYFANNRIFSFTQARRKQCFVGRVFMKYFCAVTWTKRVVAQWPRKGFALAKLEGSGGMLPQKSLAFWMLQNAILGFLASNSFFLRFQFLCTPVKFNRQAANEDNFIVEPIGYKVCLSVHFLNLSVQFIEL